MSEFDVVNRPNTKPVGKKLSALTKALLKTVEDGTAIKAPLNGRDFHSWRNCVYALARRHSLSGHITRNDTDVVMWLTRNGVE